MGHPRRTLLAVCLLFAVVSVAGCDLHRQSPPRASKGVLDLRGRDFTRDGPHRHPSAGLQLPPPPRRSLGRRHARRRARHPQAARAHATVRLLPARRHLHHDALPPHALPVPAPVPGHPIFSHTLTPFEVATLGLIAYVVWKIASLAAQHRVEATVFLLGLIVLCLAVVNDMLYVEKIIRTGFYTPFGLLFFIVSQAFLTSFRLLKAFRVVEEGNQAIAATMLGITRQALNKRLNKPAGER